MIYLNKRTGATIDSPCLLSGDDWECVSEAVEEAATVEEADAKEAEETGTETEEAKEAEEVKEEKPKRRNNKKGE